MPIDPPDQVKAYLDEIAVRLWSNNATMMVRAGFGQNAKPSGYTSALFPNRQQLGDIIYGNLHGRSPTDEANYLNDRGRPAVR